MVELVRSQLARTPEMLSPALRRLHPGHGAFRDHFPLEFRHHGQNTEGRLALRARGLDSRPFARQVIVDNDRFGIDLTVLRNYIVHTNNEQLAEYVYSRLTESARRFRSVLAATAMN